MDTVFVVYSKERTLIGQYAHPFKMQDENGMPTGGYYPIVTQKTEKEFKDFYGDFRNCKQLSELGIWLMKYPPVDIIYQAEMPADWDLAERQKEEEKRKIESQTRWELEKAMVDPSIVDFNAYREEKLAAMKAEIEKL